MGAMLASCAGACCGAAACAGLSACCSCGCFLSLPASRWVYTAAIFVSTAAALVLKYWGGELAPAGGCRYCGDEGVLRVSFGLAGTFAVLALLTLGDTPFGARVHTGFWPPKLLLLVGLLVAAGFLPLRALLAFGEACRWVGLLFLLFQIVMLIDLAYSWNEAWRDRDDELAGGWRWRAGLLLAACGLYAASLGGLALMLQYLSAEGCAFNTALLACTLVSCVGLSALSVSPAAEHGALLTSAVVCAYAAFLAYSALSSVPSAACNPLLAESFDDLRLGLGLLIAAVSLARCAWSYGGCVGEAEPSAAEERARFAPGADGLAAPFGGRAPGREGGEEEWRGVRGVCGFQLIMCVVACYAAPLLTGWRAALLSLDTPPAQLHGGEGGGGTLPYTLSWGSVWIQVASLCATCLLYGWSLVAPALFPDRDFGVV